GTLASWTIDRPLDPTFGSAPFSTTTILDGYSLPPAGVFQNTSGYVSSEVTSYPGPSTSTIPISLPAGAATWSSISVTSTTFPYTSAGVNFLRQHFEVDGVQSAGPGGIWVIDVPVS